MRDEQVRSATAKSLYSPAYVTVQSYLEVRRHRSRRWREPVRDRSDIDDSSQESISQEGCIVGIVIVIGPYQVENVAESSTWCYGSRVEAWKPSVGSGVRGYRVSNISTIEPDHLTSYGQCHIVWSETAAKSRERIVWGEGACTAVAVIRDCYKGRRRINAQAGLVVIISWAGSAALRRGYGRSKTVGGCRAHLEIRRRIDRRDCQN